ncbi:hypothetical protein H072_8076 [Dactylellina haptotyla CBS 200.50]|uniref:Uncharacterized protein n=1 Tax=Dactylellina haptotyla (strain CBS 200.50) TaxID=1284197 RepID=S8A645_DACHA|nr:hypothetical protein H072_8076 [Dactylellina haptotyla CBS 200.50]
MKFSDFIITTSLIFAVSAVPMTGQPLEARGQLSMMNEDPSCWPPNPEPHCVPILTDDEAAEMEKNTQQLIADRERAAAERQARTENARKKIEEMAKEHNRKPNLMMEPPL